MWFRRLVGVMMIVGFVGLNAIVIVGLITAPEVEPSPLQLAEQTQTAVPPTVTLSADPGSVSANTPAALTWETTGSPDSCMASGDWQGQKTAFGSESTGRLKEVKTYSFILTCQNQAGSSGAKIEVAVLPATATPTPPAPAAKSVSPKTTATYCGGRVPCYGPGDLNTHNSAGNCWGYNGDRVINISSYDAGFHKTKSGISSIEVGGICGKNLNSALTGGVSADGQTRNHNDSTKSNSDKNLIPYFVGYYDGSKP